MCKDGDIFSLAVLIDRGLDLKCFAALWEGDPRSKASHFSLYSVFRVYEALLREETWTSEKAAGIGESVPMAVGVHPFPSRTRQLSPLALTILGWKRPGKICRRRHFTRSVLMDWALFFCTSPVCAGKFSKSFNPEP